MEIINISFVLYEAETIIWDELMYHCDVTTLQRLETLSDEENVFYENQFERISFHFRSP